MITFEEGEASFTSASFPLGPPPKITPFWADVDVSNGQGAIYYRQVLREGADADAEAVFLEAENSIRNVDKLFPAGALTWMLVFTFDSVPDYSESLSVVSKFEEFECKNL